MRANPERQPYNFYEDSFLVSINTTTELLRLKNSECRSGYPVFEIETPRSAAAASILTKTAQCMFSPTEPTGIGARAITVDINSDGYTDLITWGTSGKIRLLLNNGTAFADTNISLPDAANVAQVIVGDFVSDANWRKADPIEL